VLTRVGLDVAADLESPVRDVPVLDRADAVPLVPVEDVVVEDLVLVDDGVAGRLVVHGHLDRLVEGLPVVGHLDDVEVRGGAVDGEVEVTPVAGERLPALVPPLGEHGLDAVLAPELHVPLHPLGPGPVDVLRRVATVLPDLRVGLVVPLCAPGDHQPPDPEVLLRLHPVRVGLAADRRQRLRVEVVVQQRQERRLHEVAGVAADLDRPPRRHVGYPRRHLRPVRQRRERRREVGTTRRLGRQREGRVVDQVRLVDAQVGVLGCLHRQWRVRAFPRRRPARNLRLGSRRNLAQRRLLVLCLEPARLVARLGEAVLDPPARVVAGEVELGVLRSDDELVVADPEVVGEPEPEAEPVVEHAEFERPAPAGRPRLRHPEAEVRVLLTDAVVLVPDRGPPLDRLAPLAPGDGDRRGASRFGAGAERGLALEVEAQVRGLDQRPPLEGDVVARHAVGDVHRHPDGPVGRRDGLCPGVVAGRDRRDPLRGDVTRERRRREYPREAPEEPPTALSQPLILVMNHYVTAPSGTSLKIV